MKPELQELIRSARKELRKASGLLLTSEEREEDLRNAALAELDTLQLTGWDKSRRVVILRRKAKSDVALSRNSAEGQMELLLPDQDVELWEYAVLVTNSGCALESMAQLYRDRAEEPVGLGRFYYPGHGTLSDQRPRRGIGL